MAPPSASSALWSLGFLTVLLTAAVHSNVDSGFDPLQPVTSDETVSVGGTVTLTCRVAASDNSSLQWSNTAQQTLYFGEKRALRDNRIQLHHSTPTELSITISDVQLSDEGEYTCSIFTMPVRTARATVTVLGVPGKPQISGFENAVPEGDTVTLTCTSTGSKPPAKLRWYKGDKEVEGHTDVVEPVPDDPTYNVSSELTLEVSARDNNALITCAVDHPSLSPGDKRTEHALQVLFAPEVHIQPESDLPREGEKFSLRCVGNGNPEPANYFWEKKDGELPPLAKPDSDMLYFSMLNKTDNGVYLCHADNGFGKSKGEYTLLVQDPDFPDTVLPTLDPPNASSFPPSTSIPSSSPPDVFYGSGSESTDFIFTPTSLSSPPPSPSSTPADPTQTSSSPQTTLSNALFPDLPFSPESSPVPPPSTMSISPSTASPSHSSLTPSVSVQQSGVYTFAAEADNIADPTAMSTSSGVDHAVIGGVVAVIVFILLCLLIVLGRYLIRHKGTYLTHEAKGSDDAPDADTAIINAEGGHSGAEDKKEYFI